MTDRKGTEQTDPEILFGILGVLLLGVFPLSVHDYSSITRFKYLQMLFLTGTAGFAVLAFLPSWKRSFRWKNLSRMLCVMYAAWVVLSAFFGSYASRTDEDGARIVLTGAVRYEGLITQVCYALLFLIFSLHSPRRSMILGVCAAGMTVYAAVVLCQYAGWNVLDLFPAGRSTRTNYEFQGTIGNIDMVSGYLILQIPLVMIPYVLGQGGALLLVGALAGVFLEALMEVQSGLLCTAILAAGIVSLAMVRERVRRRAGLALAGICLCFALRRMLGLPWLDGTDRVLLVFRRSALAWLALAGALLAAGWFFSKRKGCLSLRNTALIWGCVLASALVLVWLVPIGESGMLWEIHEIFHGRPSDSFGSWRWGVWRHTLTVSRDSLLFGTGPDMFYYAMQDYLQATGNVLGENFDNPHNLYLSVLAGSGLPALVLYLALVISLVTRCLRRPDAFSRAVGVSVLLYSVQGFFSFSICLISPMAWAVFGMACAQGEGSPGGCFHDLCT